MRVFDFTPRDCSADLAKFGFVHWRGGVTSEFLAYATRFTYDRLAAGADLEQWRIEGKKRQLLFEFPGGSKTIEEVRAVVAQLAGWRVRDVTLSERHVKVYDDDAPSRPAPHKDRAASRLALGLPLHMPTDSYVALYPNADSTPNPFTSSAAWRSSLDDDALPERTVADVAPVTIDVRVGDLLLFRGSSLYHERVNAGGARVLYLKFNDFGIDPAGEDPRTGERRETTLALLSARADPSLLALDLMVAPRLERVSCHRAAPDWHPVRQVSVSGSREFTIGELEWALLREVGKRVNLGDALARVGVAAAEHQGLLPRVRRLAKLGAIDFFSKEERDC